MKPPWALRLSVNTCKCYFSKRRCFLNIFVGVFITGEARETSHLIQTHSNQKKGSLQAVEEAVKCQNRQGQQLVALAQTLPHH